MGGGDEKGEGEGGRWSSDTAVFELMPWSKTIAKKHINTAPMTWLIFVSFTKLDLTQYQSK
jgi:hypothetical protein